MIRIGMIGTNFISDRLAEAARELPDIMLSAVYSRKKETGDTFAKRHGIASVYTDLECFLSSDIDAVYIASPNICHEKQAILAMQHKKHVLCEKPIASSQDALLRMISAAEENGVVLLEAMRPAFMEGTRRVKQALPQLGTLRSAFFNFCQYSSRYDRFKNGEILNAFNPVLHNAALLDIGIYPLFFMIAVLGVPNALQSRSVFLKNGFEGRGHILAAYDGMTATVDYSKIDDGCVPSFIAGENGSILIDKMSMPRRITLRLNGQGPILLYEDDEEKDMKFELSAFRDMVDKRCDPAPYLALSRETLRVLDEVRRQNGISFE